jgi:DNA-binding Lrp family transcriptional regulator
MNEATSRIDFTTFAHNINLTPNETIVEMQQLVHEGFLRRVGAGYAINEKGKNALKIAVTVPEEKAFRFFVAVDKSLGFSAHSLEEFYRLIKQVVSDSLAFHVYRGDFENWLGDVINDEALVGDVEKIRAYDLEGEELRKALLKALDERYGIGELL